MIKQLLSYVCLTIILSFSCVQAESSTLDSEKINKIQSMTKSVADFLILEELGTMPMAPKNETFIRSVLDKIGMKRTVFIRRFSNAALRQFAKNAITIDLGAIVIMYFDEDYFDQRTEQENEFLVAHEGSHAQKFHVPFQIFVSGFVLGSVINLANKHLFNDKLKKAIMTPATMRSSVIPELVVQGPLAIPAGVVLQVFLASCVSRLCEFHADVSAARALGDAQGGIIMWQRHIEDDYVPESQFRLKRVIMKIRKTIGSLFRSHPHHEQRLGVLEKFEEDNDASLFTLLWRHYSNQIKSSFTPKTA